MFPALFLLAPVLEPARFVPSQLSRYQAVFEYSLHGWIGYLDLKFVAAIVGY